MTKKKTSKSQKELALRELKAAREEMATTAAIEQGIRLPKLRVFKIIARLLTIKTMILLFLAAIVIAAGVWFTTGSTFKQETTTFVEQVQELATLATAEAHIKVILEQEDNKLFGKGISVNFPGTKRELLLVVPATVIAGVDLKALDDNDIKIDEKNKELKIVLPHADFIQEPAIQMEKVQTFSDEGLFRGETNWDEGFDLAAVAQAEIKAESIEIGLLQTAEQNAEKVLKEFFSGFGYAVDVTFK